MELDNITWTVNLYFSSDWKFLCICLSFNRANSHYYCFWCNTNKDKREDLNRKWTINKLMDQLNINFTIYNGYKNFLLFNIIPLDHWLIDELYVMLRITNQLWTLILNELQDEALFNDLAHKIIVEEMNCITVWFQFWKEQESES